MGTITSGVGLISGLNIEQIVAQLIAIDARPRDRLLSRMTGLDAQRTALLDISARIAGILSRISSLAKPDIFSGTSLSSSNPDLLSVSGGQNTPVGSYSFIVRQLASTHQIVSRGFATRDGALPSGVITLESAKARVNNQTRLDELNGYAGVQRGKFKLTDDSGASATININDAVTLSEVVDRINDAGLNINAQIRGDRLVLTETTGGSLRISEVGGSTARDLGFAPGNTFSPDGELTGADLVFLSEQFRLSALNDANGVRRAKAGGDFNVATAVGSFKVDLSEILTSGTRIERLNHGGGVNLGVVRLTTTDADGAKHTHEVDLAGLRTVGEIKSAIETAVPDVRLNLVSNKLILSYADAGATRQLKIEDVSGTASRDLGILGESATGRITGREVLVIDRLQDVLLAVNFAEGNDYGIQATIDGKRLRIAGQDGGAVQLSAIGGSRALYDLGFDERPGDGPLAGARIVGGIDSVLLRSLNGGAGYDAGQVRITSGSGSATVDLSGAATLAEVIALLNQAGEANGLGIEAGYDASGTRLVISSHDGVSPVSLSDENGNFAALSGLAQGSGPVLRSADLQRQYVSETTLLSGLNQGAGVSLGTFRITNAAGASVSVQLGQGQYKTLGDVIAEINARGQAVGARARINDTGDGLLVESIDGGSLKITDEGGTTAAGLNIAGQSDTGRIDGSFAQRIEINAGQTLDDLVAKINGRGLAQANILNDGSANPFRLSLVSRATGLAGELIVDAEGYDFGFITLNRAADARVLLGNDPQGGILVTSASNTLNNLLPGATVSLNGVSSQAVTVNVTENLANLTDTIGGLVSAFNSALDRIAELTSYDPETERRGILLGDRTVNSIERRLQRLATSTGLPADGLIRRLSQVGITLEKGRLSFDSQKFNGALEANRAEVVAFFTDEEKGLAPWMKKELEAMTQDKGLIPSRGAALETQKKQINERVTAMNDLLLRKRARYMSQFLAMERALSELQSQQGVLSQLSALAANFSTSRR